MTPSPVTVGSVWRRMDRTGRVRTREVLRIFGGVLFPWAEVRDPDTGRLDVVRASTLEQRWAQVGKERAA